MTQPATAPKAAPPTAPARSRAYDLLLRTVLMLCGIGLIVGFFLPWLHIGTMASLSGLALLIAQGEAVDMLSGPYRLMLLEVPLFGVLMIAGAVFLRRWGAWLAVIAAVIILLSGVLTLVSIFIDVAGAGMWVVTISVLLSLTVGLFGIGGRRPPV